MRLGIAQMDVRDGDLAGTVERMGAYGRRAEAAGVELLVFPAVCLTGTEPWGRTDQAARLADLADALADLRNRLPVCSLVSVFLEVNDYEVRESFLIRDGDVVPLRLLGSMTEFASSRVPIGRPEGAGDTSGYDALMSMEGVPDLPVFEVGDVTFGVALSYGELDDYDDFAFGNDVTIFMSRYPYAADDDASLLGAAVELNRFRIDARDGAAWVVGAGSLGAHGCKVFPGASFVMAPSGAIVASSPACYEDLLVCDVDPAAEAPQASTAQQASVGAHELMWDVLRLGLADTVEALGATDVVVGLDGTLACALLATLACDAVGPTHVHALLRRARSAAADDPMRRLAQDLRIDVREVVEERLALPDLAEAGAADDVFCAMLSAMARSLGAVVLLPHDKTGIALEPCPGVVPADCVLPFGDVYRSDLLDLAQTRNAVSPVVPTEGAAIPVPNIPGIGEVPGGDRARIGAVDRILLNHLEGRLELTDIVAHDVTGLASEVVARQRACETNPLACGRVLTASTRTLAEASQRLPDAWRDRVRGDAEVLASPEPGGYYSAFLERVLANGASAFELRDRLDEASDLVRQMLESEGMTVTVDEDGGWTVMGGEGEDPWEASAILDDLQKGGIWDPPFSEN